MNPLEHELAELRARVAQLEVRLDALASPGVTPEPPMIAPTKPLMAVIPAAPLPPVVARKPVSSTVWVAGIGVAIFLVGAIYGLMVSIQRGWISPAVRVGIGLVVGVGFALGAMRLIRTNRGLGVALLAAGAGTWIFSLYYGVEAVRLFAPAVGLAGSALAVLGGGWLAARERADGAMVVSVATGLIAPLAFGIARGGLDGLLFFLLALCAAQTVASYLARSGAGWIWSRLTGTVGLWLVVLWSVLDAKQEVTGLTLAWVALLAGGGLVLAWLPRHPEAPWAPAACTTVTLVGFTAASWPVWHWNRFDREGFAVVLAAQAALCLALVGPARIRSGGREHDRPLLLLAAGFGLLAVPVAWDWEWVIVAWGLAAVALTWLGRSKVMADDPGAENIQLVAALVTAAATGMWLVLALGQGKADQIFLNRVFVGAALAATAWALMLATPGGARGLAFGALQFVAVNAVAWEFARAIPAVRGEEATLAVGALLATLTYAVAGAWQWLRGVGGGDEPEAKALRIAGYAWLAVAAGKLFWHDLAGRDLVFRAVAALGVGAIFIAAALWANHRKRAE